MERTTPWTGKCRYKSMKYVKGRKDWNCCECDTVIPKGIEHQLVSGMWGFSQLEFRTCDRCVERWENLIAEHPEFNFEPFDHGSLNEAIEYLSGIAVSKG